MKNILIILIMIISWSCTISAQDQLQQSSDMRNASNNVIDKEVTLMDGISERVVTTSIIIGEIIILFLIVFYWKRTRNDSRKGARRIFKNNIQAIRNERVLPINNKKTCTKRRSLESQLKMKSLDGKSITNTAKKLSISKGELFLAARIQQLQSQGR